MTVRLLRYSIAVMFTIATAVGPTFAGIYSNPEYGFSFEYPKGYTVEASSDMYFTVRDEDGNTVLAGEVEDIESYPSDLYEGYSDPFQQFATWRAMLRCDADGPDGSAYCPSLKSTREFRTRNGFRALELMLMHVQETFGENPTREESVTGPLYLVDIAREGRTVALMLGVRPYEKMTEEQNKLASSVLDTIKFTK